MRWAAPLPLALLLCLLAAPALAASAPDLSAFTYRQQLGARIPLESVFQDSNARSMRLRDALAERPTILALGYFNCPNLCGVVRADLFDALGASDMVAGRDYTLIALSIDPSETSVDAPRRSAGYGRFPAPGAESEWHFLTGRGDAIDAVKRAVGFHDPFDPKLKQFVHPVGVVFPTPPGIVSGYLLGVGYKSTDVRFGVSRAGRGGIAEGGVPSPAALLPLRSRRRGATRSRSCICCRLPAYHRGDDRRYGLPRVPARQDVRMRFWLPEATTNAPEVDALFIPALLAISCAVLALVFGLMWTYMFRYRPAAASIAALWRRRRGGWNRPGQSLPCSSSSACSSGARIFTCGCSSRPQTR